MSKVRGVGPFLMWRYNMQLATEFLEAAGYKLFAWGVTIPVTKHGGLVITWMRKESTISQGSDHP